MKNKVYVPSVGIESWESLHPKKHWKEDFSAKSLADSWEGQDGFPNEIKNIFQESYYKEFLKLKLLLAIPEYVVTLPGGGRNSQNDLFILAKGSSNELVSIMVEGKVNEEFGIPVGEWLGKQPSKGKIERLDYLIDLLGLKEISQERLNNIRYQLLHRTASALLEARKFTATTALMLVHSFSKDYKWFDDYQEFVSLFGIIAEKEKVNGPVYINGINLYFSWAKGKGISKMKER